MSELSTIVSIFVPVLCVIALGIAFVPLARRVAFGQPTRQDAMRGLRAGLISFFVGGLGVGALLSRVWPGHSLSAFAIILVAAVVVAMLVPALHVPREDALADPRPTKPLIVLGVGLLVSWALLALLVYEIRTVESFGTRGERNLITFTAGTPGGGARSGAQSMVTTADCVVAAIVVALLAAVTAVTLVRTSGVWVRYRGFLLYVSLLSAATAAVITGAIADDAHDATRRAQEIVAAASTDSGFARWSELDDLERNLENLSSLGDFGATALLLALILGWSRGADLFRSSARDAPEEAPAAVATDQP